MIGNVWEWTTDWYCAEARGRCAEGVLHPGEPARRRARRRATIPASPTIRIPRKVRQGRLASVRAELLPPLPPGRAPRRSRSIRRRATSDSAASSETSEHDHDATTSQATMKCPRSTRSEANALSRRSMLLAGTALCRVRHSRAGAAVAQAQRAAQPAPTPADARPNILVIFGDDIGQTECQRLFVRPDGLPHAEHRPHRPRRHDVHRLLRRAELHGRPLDVHHRPGTLAHRPLQGRHCRAPRVGLQAKDIDHRRSCSSRSATPPASSARTTSATATSSCRPSTASTSSSAISTTSTPRKSRSTPTIRRIRHSRRAFGPRGVLQLQGAPIATIRPSDPRFGRVGKQTIEDTGAADQEADGDDRRRDVGCRDRLHQAPGARPNTAVLLLVQHDAHAFPHACAPECAGQAGLTSSRIRRRHDRARRPSSASS